MKQRPLKGEERIKLADALYRKYANSQTLGQRLIYWRKKYAWILIVGGAYLLKRIFDIVVSILLMVLLSPLFLIIAAWIKLDDGGPIFYISERVGKWGKEFPFPKFRTMKAGSDQLKNELSEKNIYPSDLKFKMQEDPRVTRLGKILRKTSMDELPQLYTVLIGDMSLVGPRPPLPEEVAKYTLAQRKRLDAKPGITCTWQVSGRSEISFENQVKLDVEYIESRSFWLDIKLLLKTIPAVLLGKGAY